MPTLVYIIRHNYTKGNTSKNVNQLYEDGILSKMGLVVNAVAQRKGVGYGGTYGYGYGYGFMVMVMVMAIIVKMR